MMKKTRNLFPAGETIPFWNVARNGIFATCSGKAYSSFRTDCIRFPGVRRKYSRISKPECLADRLFREQTLYGEKQKKIRSGYFSGWR